MSGRRRIERALSRRRSQSAPPVDEIVRGGLQANTLDHAASEKAAETADDLPRKSVGSAGNESDVQSTPSVSDFSTQSVATHNSEADSRSIVFDQLEASLEASENDGRSDVTLQRSHCLLLLQEARRLVEENAALRQMCDTLPPPLPGQQATAGPGSKSPSASPGAASPSATSPRNTSSRATSPLALTFKSAARAVVWSSQLRYASLQNDNAHRAALLPKALAMFVPLHDYPRVMELVDGSRNWRSAGTDAGASQRRPSLLALEQRVVADPYNESALQGLQERVQAIFVAYSGIVAEQMRCATGQRQTISPRRRIALEGEEGAKLWRRQLGKVIAAGSDYFESVYNSVYQTIKATEGLALQRYAKGHLAIPPGSNADQTTPKTVLELFQHAVDIKPRFSALIADLERKFRDESVVEPGFEVHDSIDSDDGFQSLHFRIGPLKHLSRVIEKILLCPGRAPPASVSDLKPSAIRDVVRAMAIAPSMDRVIDLLAYLSEEAGKLGLVFVRKKDRFLSPSLGGWRDCMLNFYFQDDPHRHICELQVVHKSLVTARTGLPGHEVYGRVRNAFELLECAGVDMSLWWQGSLGVEYRWTLSGVCQADAETGEISAPTYVTGGLAATLPRRFALGTNVPPVSHLLLTGMSLDGRIHGRLLQELPLLQQLDLRSNRLTGPIPLEIAQCTRLTVLVMDRNRLSGQIPTQLGLLTQLTTLDLGRNCFTGHLPVELCSMVKLRRLCADRNYLTGRLPSELGQLTSLEKLDLALNDASAERPDKIGLTGCIPSTLRNLRCLESLELHGNRLTGSVPEELFSGATSLDHVFLNGNRLTGRLPSDLGQLRRLEEFYAGDNAFTGPMPQTFPEALQTLSLMRNQLSGTVPVKALAQLPKLTVVHLNGNPHLQGEESAAHALRAGVVQRGVERGEYAQGLVYCARE